MVSPLEHTLAPFDDGSGLALVDTVSQWSVSQNPAIRFAVAQTPAELESVFRLRYREVIDRGWAQPSDFPDGLERDVYDGQALQIVGWHADDLAVTTRLLLPIAGQPLPTEAIFGLTLPLHGGTADIGRLIVAPAYRADTRHRLVSGARGYSTLLLGTLGYSTLQARAHYLIELCAAIAAPVVKLYRQIGIHVEVLGQARRYYGVERYPCRIDLVASARSLGERFKIAAAPS